MRAAVRYVSCALVILLWSGNADTQSRFVFEGMWSDPPATPEGQACFPEFCTDVLLRG